MSWSAPSLVRPLALVTLVALPRPAAAAVTWVGDFETGDTSQFDGELNGTVGDNDYIQVLGDVVARGMYAARIELHSDAVWSNGLRRVELHHSPAPGRTAEGAELYFAWSFYLPETLPTDPGQTIGYWETDNSYQQVMGIAVDGEHISFYTRYPDYTEQWSGEGVVTAGEWHRIAMRVVWSIDADQGLVEMWFDGEQVVTAAAAQTLVDGNSVFTQFGLLRGDMDFADVPVIWIDDAVEGDSLEDVHYDALPGAGDTGGLDSSGGIGSEGPGTGAGADTGGSTGGAGTTGASSATTASLTTAGSEGSASAGGSESTGSAADDDDGSGCGCASGRSGGAGLVVLALAGLGRRRRRGPRLR